MINKFKIARMGKNLTQFELAKKVGLSQNTIAWIETERQQPTERQARDIARALKVNKADIFPELFKTKVPA